MSVPDFKNLVYAWIILSLVIFIVLFKLTAPYGRHVRKGWGPSINNTLGWIIMEITSPVAFAFFYLQGCEKGVVNWIFFGLWMAHYFNRSIIFPLRLPDKSKQMPLIICLSAIFFNVMNGFFNGYYLGTFQSEYEQSWLLDWRFVLGILLFISGFIINFTSDNVLFNLRKGTARGEYKIPEGGLFNWISSPNYLGEIIEWFGWALATWSLAGLSFALWTAANLIPRAFSHHKWYKTQFSNYPSGRKSLIPGIF